VIRAWPRCSGRGRFERHAGDGGFYCARGESGEEVERKGCDCGDCENFAEFGLSKGYYCAEGSAAETED
jgi:hypothetical protein